MMIDNPFLFASIKKAKKGEEARLSLYNLPIPN